MRLLSTRQSDNHCIQYAIIDDWIVLSTENSDDDEIRQLVQSRCAWYVPNRKPIRFDRCSVCESWTRLSGRLRREIDCPAVKKAIEDAQQKRALTQQMQ